MKGPERRASAVLEEPVPSPEAGSSSLLAFDVKYESVLSSSKWPVIAKEGTSMVVH